MFRFSGRCGLLTLIAWGAWVPSSWGQASPPHVGFVYPAGGRQGTSFEVKIGGQNMDDAIGLHLSGEGVEAKILGQTRPLNGKEIGELRKMLQELEKKTPRTDSDRKEIESIRKKLAPPLVKPTPALAEIVTVEITISATAPPGPRQLRMRAKTGMSNPVAFIVGTLPEITQKKELVDPEVLRPKAPDIAVTLPATLNSQLMPGEVDRYRFFAKKGQQLVFAAHARALIPYLADAVPGFFQAALTLYDDKGRIVAYSDHFRHQQDPVLAYKAPQDGAYVLEIKDALYRGREDFVYRIDAGEIPFVTSIFPLGGPAKTRTTVAIEGWNLPTASMTLEAADMKPGIVPLKVQYGEAFSNTVPFAVGAFPETKSNDANSTIATAQPIALPIIVNGRISKPGTWNVFKFQGKVTQAIVAEIQARRLDSPLDSVLKVTDESGKTLTFSDDWEDKGQALLTHHADSFLRMNLPADGTYYVHVGDALGDGSEAHAYRLRVSMPHPDFELRVTPCSINARPGSTLAITAQAVRKDGFNGEIQLGFKYNPVDFVLDAAKIPVGQDTVRVTLQVPQTKRLVPIDLVLEGRAVIDGRKVVRQALPAEDMMQAFIYHHLVPATDLMVTVSGTARARFPGRLVDFGPIKLRAGSTTEVHIAIPKGATGNKIDLVLSDPPEGISLKKTVLTDAGAVLTVYADGEKVKPGLRGNLILEAYPESRAGVRALNPLGTLPAIPFEVLRIGK